MKTIIKFNKLLIYIIILIFISGFVFISCNNIINKNYDSKNVIKMDSTNDNIYEIKNKNGKTNLLKWIESNITIGSNIRINFLITIVIIFTIWSIRFAIIKIVWKKTEKNKVRYNWRKISGYVAVGFIIIIIGIIWIEGFESITTFLGILSAGLIFILRDPVMNFIGWIIIISRRHLEAGDRIQIAEFAGDVIDINIFYFTIMEIGNWVKADQSTGRIIHVPNSLVINNALANYTKGLEFLWNEIPVVVTFESNWQKAKKILEKIINENEKNLSKKAELKIKKAARKFLINYSKFTPIVYTDVIEYGIMLTIRYLCEPRNRRDSEAELWEHVLIKFKQHDDIDFAYPTQRFYNNLKEGKGYIDN